MLLAVACHEGVSSMQTEHSQLQEGIRVAGSHDTFGLKAHLMGQNVLADQMLA